MILVSTGRVDLVMTAPEDGRRHHRPVRSWQGRPRLIRLLSPSIVMILLASRRFDILRGLQPAWKARSLARRRCWANLKPPTAVLKPPVMFPGDCQVFFKRPIVLQSGFELKP